MLEERAAGADLRFYKNQVTPTIANLVMEPMDAEKIAVGRALGPLRALVGAALVRGVATR